MEREETGKIKEKVRTWSWEGCFKNICINFDMGMVFKNEKSFPYLHASLGTWYAKAPNIYISSL
jgi:hypothetical protein